MSPTAACLLTPGLVLPCLRALQLLLEQSHRLSYVGGHAHLRGRAGARFNIVVVIVIITTNIILCCINAVHCLCYFL